MPARDEDWLLVVEEPLKDTVDLGHAGYSARAPARGPKIPDAYKLKDGTIIQWRNASRPGGERTDIFPAGGNGMKVRLPGE
ncbi:hypothetical protein [Streptomyces pharetrae]|uniref:hypothetical protein n=1 Tax=Streptomyces pharetrae TaxID=291370 RepID=UPI0036BA441E